MTGPSVLDYLAFMAWMTVLYAAVALPLFGACKAVAWLMRRAR